MLTAVNRADPTLVSSEVVRKLDTLPLIEYIRSLLQLTQQHTGVLPKV